METFYDLFYRALTSSIVFWNSPDYTEENDKKEMRNIIISCSSTLMPLQYFDINSIKDLFYALILWLSIHVSFIRLSIPFDDIRCNFATFVSQEIKIDILNASYWFLRCAWISIATLRENRQFMQREEKWNMRKTFYSFYYEEAIFYSDA